MGPYIMAPVTHSPARNKKTTTALRLSQKAKKGDITSTQAKV